MFDQRRKKRNDLNIELEIFLIDLQCDTGAK